MKPVIRDAAIGLTALAGAAGLIIVMLLFGELSGLTDSTYRVRYVLDTVEGLERGSVVTLNGVHVGKIVRMSPITEPDPGVDVEIDVFEDMRIPRTAEVSISVGLLGEGKLALTIPQPEQRTQPLAYLQPGDEVQARASTILDQLSRLLDQRLKGLNDAAASMVKLSDTYTEVGRQIADLTERRDLDAVDRGEQPANVASTIARVDLAVAGAERWLGDEQLQARATALIEDFQVAIDDAADTFAAWRDAAQRIQDRADQIGDRFFALGDDLGQLSESVSLALRDVRRITDQLNDGDGTLGQLLRNPDLYNALTDSAQRLEIVLEEAQLMIEKFKAEGVPIKF